MTMKFTIFKNIALNDAYLLKLNNFDWSKEQLK